MGCIRSVLGGGLRRGHRLLFFALSDGLAWLVVGVVGLGFTGVRGGGSTVVPWAADDKDILSCTWGVDAVDCVVIELDYGQDRMAL